MIKSNDKDKVPKGAKRSSDWRTLRKEFLKVFSKCALCGGKKNLEVHHILPFHLYPGHELDFNNLITLCENKKDGVNCHLLFGHLGNFKSFNRHVRIDAIEWARKIINRPITQSASK